MAKKGKLIALASAGGAVLVLVLLAAPVHELALEAWLIGKLDSGDGAERIDAARRLGELGSVRAVVPLLLLRDEEPIHDALTKIVARRGLDAVRRITPDLDAVHPRERLRAARLLAKAGPAAAPILPDLLAALRKHSGHEPEIQVPLLEAVAGTGAPGVPALAELVKGTKESLAYQAACCLGDTGAAAMPAIADLLDDPSGSVRWLALHALIGLGPAGRPAAPRATELLLDPDIAVREHARAALAGMKLDLTARVR